MKKIYSSSSKILDLILLFFSIILGLITAVITIFLSEFLSFKVVSLKKNQVLLMDFFFSGRDSYLFPKQVKT